MRDLIVTENISLDGVIDGNDGWFVTWEENSQVEVDDLNQAQREHQAQADAVLMGRVTFEEMRSYWPHQTDDQTGVTEYLNRVSKYVVSSTLEDPDWENSRVISAPVPDAVQGLKAQPGGDIVVTGSIQLVHELIARKLVDEYRLFLYPTVLGEGRRLFDHATGVGSLELAESRQFRSGIMVLRYRPKGK
jgi:dihydrofolate reductase